MTAGRGSRGSEGWNVRSTRQVIVKTGVKGGAATDRVALCNSLEAVRVNNLLSSAREQTRI